MNKILNEIAKHDTKWRAFALKICNDKTLADDLTQEMYLRVSTYTKWNNSLIHRIIYNLFIDYVRTDKEIGTDNFDLHSSIDKNFEPDDKQQKLLDAFYKLGWRQQALIEESYDKSFGKIEKDFPMINYGYAFRQVREGLRKIHGANFDKDYNNKKSKRTWTKNK